GEGGGGDLGDAVRGFGAVEREGDLGGHGGERERAVQVRKEVAAAGRLPAQRGAEGGLVDGEQEQAGTAGEVAGGGLADLGGGGEVDVPVGEVHRRAVEAAGGAGTGPLVGPEQFVDRHVG